MQATAHIIYFNYLNADGNGTSIGGIQTYISNLIPVFQKEGMHVSIYQRATADFVKDIVSDNGDSVKVYGIKCDKQYGEETKARLFAFASQYIVKERDLLVFGCESAVVPCKGYKSIAVQHGISWDVADEEPCNERQYLWRYIKKCKHAWDIIRRVSYTQSLVCVDYNFINWYRAIVPYSKIKMYAVPNFTTIPSLKASKNDDNVSIIFARRFFKHRGTRIFTDAIARILEKYEDVTITVAGTGPDEKYIRDRLGAKPNVEFITYDHTESMKIHQDKAIALVPTTGSEGTSLSLLEAMASGCAVVCSNVGGMTNIILDHFNGIMINPDADLLFNAICELIENRSLRQELQSNAYLTASKSFSLDVWKERWSQIIQAAMRK